MIESSLNSNNNKAGFWNSAIGTITKITTFVTALSGLIYAISQLNHSVKTVIPETPTQIEQSALISTQASNPGKYPQASERLLSSDDLQNLNKSDLKIMRNEIFARHGYIFKTPDMNSYFKYQSWYSPKYNDVTSLLTDIEKKNIELIKRYEY